MKKMLSFSVLSLIAMGLAFSQNIKFTSEEVDLGIIPKGSRMSHKFEFKNEGDVPLIINKLESVSQTLMATAPTKAIAPGEIGFIEITCVGENFGGIYSTLTVYSNARNGMVTLRMRGEVM